MQVATTALIQKRTSILQNPIYSQSSRAAVLVFASSAPWVATACTDEKARIQAETITAIRDRKRFRLLMVVFPNKN